MYIDGADEIDGHGYMLKGGGAALTREKIVAAQAKQFVCIVDQSKRVDVMGAFPLPVEVIPMSAPQISRNFASMGGNVCVSKSRCVLAGDPCWGANAALLACHALVAHQGIQRGFTTAKFFE